MLNDKGEEVGIIYGWYCTVTDKWYIGQTIKEEKRFKDHIRLSLNNDNTHFHRALRKYGLENFVYCVLEENVLRENLNMREMDWIEYYDSLYDGYNMSAGGGQTIFSEEFKRKISESRKGQFLGEKHPFYGKHHSEEVKKKMSESRKGQHSCWKGKHLPKETREKISNALKGQNKSEETKRKLSEYHKQLIGEKHPFYGKHHSEETRKKLSESHKGKRMPEETRKKISNTLKNKLALLSKNEE